MTSETPPATPDTVRRAYGTRSISALVPRVARPAFRGMSPAASQVMADWTGIVGPALGAASAPLRLHLGTLTVACVGPVAMEMQHYAAEIIGRINGHLGSTVVRQLRLVQTMPVAAPAPADPPPAAPPNPAVDAAVADVSPAELRAALRSLGRAVLAPKAPRRKRPTA